MKMQEIYIVQTKISIGSHTVPVVMNMNSKNVDLKYKFRYSGNATITKHSITKTRLFKYTENFTTKKWKFSD